MGRIGARVTRLDDPPLLRAIDPHGDLDVPYGTEPAVVVKECGDLAAAFAQVAQVAEVDLKVACHSGVPLETRGALAVLEDATGMALARPRRSAPLVLWSGGSESWLGWVGGRRTRLRAHPGRSDSC